MEGKMPKNVSIEDLAKKAKELRLNIVNTAFHAKSGHVGGSLSCADLLTALYFKHLNIKADDAKWEQRDRFIMSKGHCALAYIPCLAMAGFVPMSSLETFNAYESAYGMHPDSKKINGCDASTGSLGHGLPMGVGMALANKYKGIDAKTVVMLGDGECDEGSVWEGAMCGANYKLHNLIAIVDRNGLMIDGPTEEVMALEPFDKKWEAFGWHVIKINGNDMADVDRGLTEAWAYNEGPVCILAATSKGKGVKRFENQVAWHYGAMDSNLLKEAVADIEAM